MEGSSGGLKDRFNSPVRGDASKYYIWSSTSYMREKLHLGGGGSCTVAAVRQESGATWYHNRRYVKEYLVER